MQWMTMSTSASEAILDGLRGRAVSGGQLAVAVGLVRHRGQLGDGVRVAIRVRRARGTAARDELDVVVAFLEPLAVFGSDRRFAVSLGAEVAHLTPSVRAETPVA